MRHGPLSARGLSYITENLLKTSEAALVIGDPVATFLIYDGIILGPARGGTQFVTAIKERAALFPRW